MDEQDSGTGIALLVVGFVVALVLMLVLGVAISHSRAPAVAGAAAAAPAPMSAVPADDGPVARLYFEVGSASLPADAGAVLEAVAGEARTTGLAVVISGFHDESGDAQQNHELAKQRAQAVQHALEANGVARERLMLMKPQSTSGGGDSREARRVELRVR